MKHLLATVALGPLLLLQGRHVRRVTPKLPEPPGPRSGEVGEGALLRLLILGDSAAAGVGAQTQDQALSGQLVQALSPHFRVRWLLRAQTGITTVETLQQLRDQQTEVFDVVVTSLGVNDVTGNCSPARWLRNKSQLLSLLQQQCQARLVLLSELPPMHRFPALPQPLRWYLGAQAQRYNRGLQNLLQQRSDCRLVKVPVPADGADLVASDGFHPGPGFYRLWGQQLAQDIRRYWQSAVPG